MEVEQDSTTLLIGYYPFRAKAQVLRLVCEYLHLPYRDWFFDPDQWSKFKSTETDGWVIKDLPFLKHGNFVVTGTSAMVNYVCQLAKRPDLLGSTLSDQTKVDAFRNKGDLKDIILSIKCNSRSCSSSEPPEVKRQKMEMCSKKVHEALQQYEQECEPNNFYLGYLTVLDFYVYQTVNYLKQLCPNAIHKFSKVKEVAERVAALKEIKEYQESDRAVREYCPIKYFSNFKEKMKSTRESGSSCGREMEPEEE